MKRMKVLTYLYDQKTAMNLTGKRTVCCGEFIVIDKIHSDKTKKLFKAGKLPSIYTKLSKCRERGDTWSEEVCTKISLSVDLVASDVIYHQQCKSNFLTKMFQVKDRAERHPGVFSTNQWLNSLKFFVIGWIDKLNSTPLSNCMNSFGHLQ